MSKEYFVYVQASDYYDIEAETEEDAKQAAKDIFLSNTISSDIQADVIRVTEYKDLPTVNPEGSTEVN